MLSLLPLDYLLSLLDNVIELLATETGAQFALTSCLIKF